jgi:putative ABC transport system permease protein
VLFYILFHIIFYLSISYKIGTAIAFNYFQLNTYTFHINSYDLAFLGAIFIGLTFILLLWFAKRINRAANRFLAMALAVVALWIARILGIDIGLSAYITNWSRLPLQF